MLSKSYDNDKMRTCFINAGIEIIKKEGLKNFKIRNIGEKAGFSYATLYKYFKNMDEFIEVCTLKLIEHISNDIEKYILLKNENKIIQFSAAYMEIFIENPDWFYFIFFDKVNKYQNNLYKNYMDIMLVNSLENELNSIFTPKEKYTFFSLLLSCLNNNLLLFLKRKTNSNKDELLYKIENEIVFILGLY